MNRKDCYFPPVVLIYFLVMLLAIFFSWAGSIYEIRFLGGVSEPTLRSLLAPQGFRLMLRSAANALSSAPVGHAMFVSLTFGIVLETGLSKTVWAVVKKKQTAPKQRNALLVALFMVLICLFLLFVGLFGHNRLLLSFSGSLKRSPLADSWAFMLFLLVALPSIVYGLVSDTLRSARDCVRAFEKSLVRGVPFLLTMLVASQLVGVLSYSNLLLFFGMNTRVQAVTEVILYWIPLVTLFRPRG